MIKEKIGQSTLGSDFKTKLREKLKRSETNLRQTYLDKLSLNRHGWTEISISWAPVGSKNKNVCKV